MTSSCSCHADKFSSVNHHPYGVLCCHVSDFSSLYCKGGSWEAFSNIFVLWRAGLRLCCGFAERDQWDPNTGLFISCIILISAISSQCAGIMRRLRLHFSWQHQCFLKRGEVLLQKWGLLQQVITMEEKLNLKAASSSIFLSLLMWHYPGPKQVRSTDCWSSLCSNPWHLALKLQFTLPFP